MTFWRANIRQIKYERLFLLLNGVLLNCLTVSSRWDRENLCKACLYVRKTALSPENIEWQISNGIPICLFVFILYFLFAIFYLLYKVTLVQFLVARENENKANFREISTIYKKQPSIKRIWRKTSTISPCSHINTAKQTFYIHWTVAFFFCYLLVCFFFHSLNDILNRINNCMQTKRDKNARVKAMAKWRSN